MNRFRKRSDPKRAHVPVSLREGRARTTDTLPPLPPAPTTDTLPPLPPASDFRTSLILPDLTRRFSVLRNSSGEPIGVDELKSRFEAQRARGSHNRVSVYEEDMILEALSRLRTSNVRQKSSAASGTDDIGSNLVSTYSDDLDDTSRHSVAPSLAGGQSVRSTTTTSSALHASPSIASMSSGKGSQVGRRMSNNLFGSGKFHDYSYMRGAHQRRTPTSPSIPRSMSMKHSDSVTSMSTVTSSRAGNNTSMYSDSQSLRPVTPEGSAYTNSVPSSPNKMLSTRDEGSDHIVDFQGLGTGLTKALFPDVLGRASLALDEVIRELEEEGDDEVLVERSPISVTPNNYIHPTEPSPLSTSPPSPPADEPGMAFSSDDQVSADEVQRTSPYPHSRTTSPIPRLPGYIPGMPRPMTPRETSEGDDQTPSATPRATSPRLPGVSPQPPPSLVQSFSSMYRTNSNTSTSRTSRPTSPANTTPVSPSPLFFNRMPSGRFTPEDRNDNGSSSPEPIDSPVLGRRRPLSPLSGSTFQPMAPVSSSRPSTPSNITWNTTSSPTSTRANGRNGSISTYGHSRNGSVTSVADNTGDLDQSRSSARSLRSPVLPDSPWVDMGHEPRPPSAMSGMELGSPIQMSNRSLRSPTPTYGTAHSPTSHTFPDQGAYTNGHTFNGSRRSSRQNAHSSFTVNSPHALLLSPIANSSRSSLESAGSSYHSWDEDHKKDRLFSLFSHLDPQPEWHDFSAEQSGSSTSRTTPSETQETEELVRHQMGLNKTDIFAIQEKLVSAALTKAATPEGRHRANSVRKRRPSTSQSVYSYNGGESRVPTPAPQAQQAAPVATAFVATAPASRASIPGQIALLDAVVDSIESPRNKAVNIPPPEETRSPDVVSSPLQSKASSPSMRQRALADVLFGTEDREAPNTSPQLPVIRTPDEERPRHEREMTMSSEPPQQGVQKGESTAAEIMTPTTPGPSSSSLYDYADPNLLAIDVQRRAEAATAALRKSPSIPKIAEAGSTRRRISPSQISSPKLLSASTSVDTIPLPSVQMNQQQATGTSTTKLGSRFKKLRGTLRTKTHVPEEVTPYPLGLRTPTSAQTATYHPSPSSSGSPHGVASATEPYHPKISPPVLPSPPASATPGLRGFMSLFRKQRHTGSVDVPLYSDRRGTPLSPPQMIPASVPPRHESAASSSHQQVQSAPPEQSQFLALRPLSPQSPLATVFPSSETIPEDTIAPPLSAPVGQNEEAALKQLFNAANDLGLDQAALNALVARSPSLSSRPTLRSKSRSSSVTENRPNNRSDVRESGLSQSPLLSDGRPSMDASSARPSLEIRQVTPSLTIRKNQESTLALRPHQAGTDKTIVRRTIIVPSDSKTPGFDLQALNALMRKQSLTRRRRSGGATSVQSNRSLQDRAPTPPPPRSIGGKRFSTDRTPPVPQLPSSHPIPLDIISPVQVEQSSSAYDSLYEMYASDSKAANINGVDPEGSPHVVDEESRPAVEVIELANGETIWSIVNGLRDDDAESFYDNRRSFASDYSGEGVKVFFKEHGRKTSKSSNTSFLSRKKQLQAPSPSNRPETKVFFSSSAQIGRLIESLSRDLDAGSFNITPDHTHGQGHAGHSTSSSVGSVSDMRWTLEERLEHMLGAMSANP